jgi:hypothetical protein
MTLGTFAKSRIYLGKVRKVHFRHFWALSGNSQVWGFGPVPGRFGQVPGNLPEPGLDGLEAAWGTPKPCFREVAKSAIPRGSPDPRNSGLGDLDREVGEARNSGLTRFPDLAKSAIPRGSREPQE